MKLKYAHCALPGLLNTERMAVRMKCGGTRGRCCTGPRISAFGLHPGYVGVGPRMEFKGSEYLNFKYSDLLNSLTP
ncbi:hypothetical protein BMS3Abin12_01088 [bacterium BMS3Abin12]|nr:hypothetical protein BMS3Abin12_01088 [bacterium BMS3Abin12]